ncbi:cob(I)yrinic acid a,c-diamide adenosyltransferase [Oxyplasma meridianum]|uniref:Cob(I)yrinic acid a,c-diamide adenosyltransferase n=1 Tax=Oxyplasma meridianum TaxID=3073602 RepID=A0AAX4NGC2_9ARCH
MKIKDGLIEVYTGNGKGKTTAAFGLAFRASGWGYKVYVLQFMKLGTYGENRGALKFPDSMTVKYVGMPYFIAWEEDMPIEDRKKVRNVRFCKKGVPPPEYRAKVQEEFLEMEKNIAEGKWDIVILDEINVALYYNLLSLVQVLNMLDKKPVNVEVVLTGRKMPEEIMERASLVTEMKEIKHPYSKGYPARRGIDF